MPRWFEFDEYHLMNGYTSFRVSSYVGEQGQCPVPGRGGVVEEVVLDLKVLAERDEDVEGELVGLEDGGRRGEAVGDGIWHK
jgi:hypothetical protein